MTDLGDFELSKRKLSNSWRVSEPYSVSKRNEEEFQSIVAQLRAIPREKIPPTTTQAASTTALLEAQKLRPESADAAYAMERRLAAIPEDAQVRDESGEVFTNEREVGLELALLMQDNRRAAKNQTGQSTESSVTPEKREKGIHAFTYSKPFEPTNAELMRINRLGKLEAVMATEPAPAAPEKKKRWPWQGEGRPLTDQEFQRFIQPKWWQGWFGP